MYAKLHWCEIFSFLAYAFSPDYVLIRVYPHLPSEMKGSRSRPSPREIHNLCVHVMKLSSTTVSAMRPVLWPFLLEFLLLVDCTEAVGIICDSIANLLSKPQVCGMVSFCVSVEFYVNEYAHVGKNELVVNIHQNIQLSHIPGFENSDQLRDSRFSIIMCCKVW